MRILAKFGNYPLTLLANCYAVTAIAGLDQNVAQSESGHFSLPAELYQAGLHSLMLSSADDERSRVIILPFTSNVDQPVMVLKTPRRADFNIYTEHEQVILSKLHTLLDEELRLTIPQPLAKLQNGNLVVGIESYTSGTCLSSSISRWRGSLQHKIEDLRLTTAWLGKFHQQTQLSREIWGPLEVTRWVEEPLAAYKKIFSVTASEERLFHEVRRQATDLTGLAFPIVWQHHDFGQWNIYRTENTIRVIDWECARVGPALADLLYFVVHWSYLSQNLRDDEAQLRCFRELFVEPAAHNTSVNAVWQVIKQYMHDLDLDIRFFPLLLVLSWVEHALDRSERQRAIGEKGQDPRSGNRYIQYIRILAEYADRLFTKPI
jgi:hypothetical protein